VSRLLLALFLFALTACGSGKPRPPLTDGERLYRAKCTSCHRTYEPEDYAAQRWPIIVAQMEKARRVHLSDEQRAIILGYLTGNPAMTAR